MHKAGVILTAVGEAALGFAADSDDGYGSAILLMFVKGNRRRARYHEWLEEQEQHARLTAGACA